MFDKKENDWKYWDENGKEIPAPKENHLINQRGQREFYIDGVKVENKSAK